ncbi:hypothetical protein GYMLUDRAFT_39088 [Collybiopsis luxurians FD-317 M1]|nr:hypothetical protein GYMLUDRAFT_39088 [Collybiopsis luxurians FD-317 M1]
MTPSHSEQLAESLSKLELSLNQPNGKGDANERSPSTGTPRIHEGYGFRPPSGVATPLIASASVASEALVPDSNGLGWPGRN